MSSEATLASGEAVEQEVITANANGEEKDASADDMSAPQPVEPAAPALTSTYDPARAKRAGWWSKARSAFGSKE